MKAEVGKWFLTLAIALGVTGALSAMVKQIDQRRADREAWHSILNDLVAMYQTIQLTQLRLDAHRSALTYRKQVTEVMNARVELGRIRAINRVNDDNYLRAQINGMCRYLDKLGEEYEASYLKVSRQQRLDEAWLTKQIKTVAARAENPVLSDLSDQLAQPTQAWRQLKKSDRFPRLAALLNKDVFEIDVFRANYRAARRHLEARAGFAQSAPACDATVKELSTRTAQFLEDHPDAVSPEVKKQIKQQLDKLNDIYGGMDERDPAGQEAAKILWNKANEGDARHLP